MKKYHNMLCNEIRSCGLNPPAGKSSKIKTIFFGGGTPSRYPLALLKELFQVIAEPLDTIASRSLGANGGLEEVTIETNPGDVTPEHLETWKALGINRLSIGVQILDEKILHNVNRYQTNQSVENILALAPKYFENISVDLILGLPGTTTKIWFDTVKYLISKPISHISVYFLTLYEQTKLYSKVETGEILLPNEDLLVKTYEKTIPLLEKHGFFQYEISNFAKPGRESLHNKSYWNGSPYRGFGLSAASLSIEKKKDTFVKKRLVNSKNLVEYLDHWGKNKQVEILTPGQAFLEELMLGLRQQSGIDLQRVVYSNKENISQLKKRGLIEEKDGRLFLTIRGMVLENEVLMKLM
jgi:oxygen-independent coproporphyrinogen-3 oxidase